MWPFSTPHHKEVAELRECCIVAETKNILLADEPERARRPKRERRRDAASVVEAKAKTTEALMRMQGRVG